MTGVDHPDDLELRTSRPLRLLYGALGFVFLGIGIVGTVVPVLPGFVNLLVALFFFSRSSERMHGWMLTNRWFGTALREYRAGLGISRRIKVIAVVSMAAAVGISVGFFVEALWLRLAVAAVAIYGVWFVLTRPTRELELQRRAASVAS